jgi:hypothetical protein
MIMTSDPAARDAVKHQVLDGFHATPYPGDDDLVRGGDPECRAVADAFRGVDWRDVTIAMVRDHKEALPLFTPGAFRYFLPAYLIGCLDAPAEVDVALDGVVFNLTPPSRAARQATFGARAQLFSAAERAAIVAFLEWMDAGEIADWASAGMEPPERRAKPALAYWRGAAPD